MKNNTNKYIKPLFGTSLYRVNLDKRILDLNGNDVTDKFVTADIITINIFNKLVTMEYLKLFLISWFEVDPEYFKDCYNDIDFVKVTTIKNILRFDTGYIMVFNKPKEYISGFRFIPHYTNYACNEDGVVINIRSNTIIPHMYNTDGKTSELTYPLVAIRDGSSTTSRGIPVHRLVALAWVENKHPDRLLYINHIDGNKANPNSSNLEWCTLKENAEHAYATGLNQQRTPMKTRDRNTGKIEHYISVNDLIDKIGYNSNSILREIRDMSPGKLVNGKYEVKREDDDTPWFYENPEHRYFDGKKTIFVITALNTVTGDILKFNRKKTLHEVLGITKEWTKGQNIARTCDILNEKQSVYKFTYEVTAVIGPYAVYDCIENKKYVKSSLIEIEKLTGISRNISRIDLLNGFKYIYNNRWKISLIDNYKEMTSCEYKVRYLTVNYDLTNELSGVTTRYESLRDIERNVGITKATLKRGLDNNGIMSGYTIRPVYL